jgi:hypothetical protein
MNLSRLLNPPIPVTPPQQLCVSTCVPSPSRTRPTDSTDTPLTKASVWAGQAASQSVQRYLPPYSGDAQAGRYTGSQDSVSRKSHDQLPQVQTASHTIEALSGLGRIERTQDSLTVGSPGFEQTPARDATRPPVAPMVASNQINDKKVRKAVKQPPKRRRRDITTVHVATDPVHGSPLAQSLETARETDVLQSHTLPPPPSKRVGRYLALGLGLGARPRKRIQGVLLHPLELPVPGESTTQSEKRKRSKPNQDEETDLDSTEICVWRPVVGEIELGTFGGWAAYKMVEADEQRRDDGANASRGDADPTHPDL